MSKLFALIPAAGSGSRMGAGLPKQYLPLAGKPLLHHALGSLCRHAAIERVFVVLAAGDRHYAGYDWQPFAAKLEPLYCGGETRAASVFNGLLAARDAIDGGDWVLVHDAVRPCLAPEVLERLIGALRDEQTGGLLAAGGGHAQTWNADARYADRTARESVAGADAADVPHRVLEALRAIEPARDR